MRIEAFDFSAGTVLAKKYVVLQRIGKGWEGEVYLVRERGTGVLHAAKVFFPHRDKRGKSTRFTARKLHKLRKCSVLIHYHTQEKIVIDGVEIKMLISEFVEGEIMSVFLKRQRGSRTHLFEGLHFLRAIALGVADIHDQKEYHGDIHEDNVIVSRKGVWFEVKLVDVYDYGRPMAEHMLDDVVEMIRMFYEMVGGQKQYGKHPQWVRDLCCGLKKSLIKKKFKTARQLVQYLDTFSWE